MIDDTSLFDICHTPNNELTIEELKKEKSILDSEIEELKKIIDEHKLQIEEQKLQIEDYKIKNETLLDLTNTFNNALSLYTK